MERSLGSADGVGVLRIEEHVDRKIDDVWAALTEPRRLAQWYGDIDGDLRSGATLQARLHASGWEGTKHVEACEPPRRLLVTSKARHESVTEVTLADQGDETTLVVEQRGLPAELLWAYGAGLQIHLEDLVAHLGGRERCDSKARFDELEPAYRDLAAALYRLRELRGGRFASAIGIAAFGSCSIGVSQYGHTCQSASSGRLQVTQACRSLVVQTGQTRNSAPTSARQTGQ